MSNIYPAPLNSPVANKKTSDLKGLSLARQFIGRGRELHALKQRLSQHSAETRQLLITGPAGQGKTALAVQLALNLAEAGWQVFSWCANPPRGKAFSHFIFDDLALQLNPENTQHFNRLCLSTHRDAPQRDQALLELLVSQCQGKLLLVLDNLESLQDNNTCALNHPRLQRFIQSAQKLGAQGLSLIMTTRRPLPGWSEQQHWPLDNLSAGDFMQLTPRCRTIRRSLEETAPSPPIHQLLNVGSGVLLEAAQPSADEATRGFIGRLKRSNAELRYAMVLNSVLQTLEPAELALLQALQVFEEPVTLAAVVALFNQQPSPTVIKAQLEKLVALCLVQHSQQPTPSYYCTPAVAEGVNAQMQQRPPPAMAQLAANYLKQAYNSQSSNLYQALVCHRALQHAQQTEAAKHFALKHIVEPLQNAGWHQVLLETWLPLLQLSASPALRAKALIATGQQYNMLGNSAQALLGYQQGLKLQRSIGEQHGAGDTLNKLSLIYHQLGDYKAAIKCLKQSLAIWQQLGDKPGQAITLNNLSQIFNARGECDTALKYLKQSLSLFRDTDDKKGQGSALNNIAGIYRAAGDYKNALNYLAQSLALRRTIGDRHGEGITLNNMSAIACGSGDHQGALNYMQQSLAIAEALGDKSGEATTLNNISAIYYASGDNQAAIYALKQCLAIKTQLGDEPGVCFTLFDIGHLYLEKQRDAAISCWLQCYQLAKQRQLTQVLQALHALSEQLQLSGGLDYWQNLMEQQTTSEQDNQQFVPQ